MSEGVIAMSKKELTRLEVVRRVTDKQMGHSEGARLLSLSERQVKRLVSAFRKEGAAGLVSKRRGQPSNNRTAQAIKAQVIERLRDRYAGFGPTLAAEYLQGDGYGLSKETLRGWMMEAGLWRAKKKREAVHPPR